MRSFLRAIRSLIGPRLGLTLVAGIGLVTQIQCGGAEAATAGTRVNRLLA